MDDWRAAHDQSRVRLPKRRGGGDVREDDPRSLVRGITNNPTAIAYISEAICTWVGGLRIEPLSVAYHDTMHDDPQLTIKVVRATANPEKPDPAKIRNFGRRKFITR